MNNRKGMTLIEVVVALGIFGIMMVTIFPAFILTKMMNSTAHEFTQANYYAQDEIEKVYYYSKTLSLASTLTNLQSSDGYTCTYLSCNKTVDTSYVIHLDFTEDTPSVNIDTLVVTVNIIRSSEELKRSTIEYYIRFAVN